MATNSDEDESLVIFDPNRGSPYSPRRSPQFSRSEPTSILKTGSSPFSDEFEIYDLQLPVELQRTRSMQSLRYRRDPNYHGIRSRKPRRVIDKIGQRNVGYHHIPERSRRFIRDFVTTFVEEQWRYVITVFACSFFACWLFFAVLWYLIAHSHGDLEFDTKTGERLSEGDEPCVQGATNFVGFFLLSMETQSSIGFGERYPNANCPEGLFLLVLQIIIGVGIEGAMVGIVYAKMVRPPRKSSNMKFSKRAVICQRDSKLCLLFRVSDSNESHIVQSKVTAFWFQEKVSKEGEILTQFQHQLKLENDGKVFVIFPLVLCHIIDESSPLYQLSAMDVLEKRFEIVVCFTGSSRATGQISEERTSYLPREILWGHRFKEIVEYDCEEGVYLADYDRFDEIEIIDTPLCSAMEWDNIIRQYKSENDKITQTPLMDASSINECNETLQLRRKENEINLARELEHRLSQISAEQKVLAESEV